MGPSKLFMPSITRCQLGNRRPRLCQLLYCALSAVCILVQGTHQLQISSADIQVTCLVGAINGVSW